MENLILIERITYNKDWATLLFFIGFSIIAINRNVFDIRFAEFTRLLISDKYLKIYKDNTNIKNSFTLSFIVLQFIAITFFVQICLYSYGWIHNLDLISFIQIINFLSFFVIGKYLLEKIIANSFYIEDFADALNLQKATYRNYFGLILLCIDILLFYNNITNKLLLNTLIFAVVITNILLYIIFIKNHQKIILNKLFYFILYLCTLEIAPYFLLYFWFKNFRA